jgi:hypothetical protein
VGAFIILSYKDLDVSILLNPDSNDDQVIMATRDNGSKVTISKNGFAFMKNPAMSKNVVELTEYENPRQRLLE